MTERAPLPGAPIPVHPAVSTATLVRRCALAAALLTASCGDSTSPRVPITLELDRSTIAIEVGDTVRVTARVLDQDGQVLDQPSGAAAVTWSSTSSTVATVQDGLVTGVRPGNSTISARTDGIQPVDVPVEVSPRTHAGEIRFDYAGERNGTFSLSSTFQILSSGPTADSWVVTFFDAQFGSQDVFAWRERADGLIDLAWFWVQGAVTQPGTRPAEDGVLLLGYDLSLDVAEAIFQVTVGSLTFTSVNDRQLGGSFALSMVDPEDSPLEVSNGTFVAPVVPSSVVLGAPAAAEGAAASGGGAPDGLERLVERLRDSRRSRRL